MAAFNQGAALNPNPQQGMTNFDENKFGYMFGQKNASEPMNLAFRLLKQGLMMQSRGPSCPMCGHPVESRNTVYGTIRECTMCGWRS